MDNRKITLCLTTWNRPEVTIRAFSDVINDSRISEIIIVDDFSSRQNYNKLAENILALKTPKIKLYRNNRNWGVYKNKQIAVSLATNDYVIQFDSDNVLPVKYIDTVYAQEWKPNVIFAPTFAEPVFDYRAFSGIMLDKKNIKEYLGKPMMSAMLNTMNYFVNRDEYLKTWEVATGVNVADSIYMNYLWFKRGNYILPLEGLSYSHIIHGGSNYTTNIHRSQQMPIQIENKIMELK